MGDAGVATSPDVNSQHWNPAKYPFASEKAGIAFHFTPWLRNLIPDINLLYLAGFYRMNDRSSVSGSVRYFSLGEIYFNPITGPPAASYHPVEFALDAGYSLKFTESFSGGLVLRYIHSDLVVGQPTPAGDETHPGRSVAGDLGLYYRDSFVLGGMDAQWSWGMNISNIGPPVSYSDDSEGTLIPTNLRTGSEFLLHFNEDHSLSVTADLNKLMVPTPPVYGTDTATGGMNILYGIAPPSSVVGGMLQSFYDAPGWEQEDGSRSVFREELAEIQLGAGAEYRYRDRFGIRTGYFHEHAAKGNRKYFTFGADIFFGAFGLGMSYLIPTNGMNTPLANTIRISLAMQLGAPAGQDQRDLPATE